MILNILNDLRDSKQLQRDTKVDERDSNRPQKQLQKDVCRCMYTNDLKWHSNSVCSLFVSFSFGPMVFILCLCSPVSHSLPKSTLILVSSQSVRWYLINPLLATVWYLVSKVCVCLLGAPPDSQLSTSASPASPTQDIWVLRSSPTGKGVWSLTPATPHTLCELIGQIQSQPSW